MPDEYGCFRPFPDDWDCLSGQLKEFGAIYFTYLVDEGTTAMVTLASPVRVLGTPHWGGHPAPDALFVGIRNHGAMHFNTRSWTGPEYVAEKLNLEETPSLHVAGLINEIGSRLNT